ncbi:MAG: dehydratase [Hyphomicrobiales bacterium]|nr:dehydratase [Hyphomicrobiales bacterium]
MTLPITLEDLRAKTGTQIVAGDWIVVQQDDIDRFADLSGDRQWIHVDPERAARESPWGGTIAHGFLTLALFTRMMGHAVRVEGAKFGVNYGFDRLRFTDIVRCGDRIRARGTLESVEDIKGGAQVRLDMRVEREGHEKPALVALWLLRYYF